MKNLKEFKALIERYESITLEEIKKIKPFEDHFTAQKLTGFGNIYKCTLCVVVGQECKDCVYSQSSEKTCMTKTHYRISDAETPTKLRNAFRARAKHMKTLI